MNTLLCVTIGLGVIIFFKVLKVIIGKRETETPEQAYQRITRDIVECNKVEEMDVLESEIEFFENYYAGKVADGKEMLSKLQSLYNDKHFQIVFPEYSVG